MRILKGLILLLTVSATLLCLISAKELPSPRVGAIPSLSAQSAILVNGENGAVYAEKSPDTPMGPASTTKLMTALVVLRLADPDRLLTVPREAVGVEGSSIYLVEGEQLTVGELLSALLLSSANDAATALAVGLSGSLSAFADEMNREAARIGLTGSHFTNPHGLYDEDHYTTARDLSRIALEVLRIPLLRQTVSTYKTTIPLNGEADRRLLVNHNRLLRSYEGAIGMKTGYTRRTGRTLVSAAEREGLTLIAVTLNAPDDWRDHKQLLDYGFATYEKQVLYGVGEFRILLPVVGGVSSSVTLTNKEPLVLTLPRHREECHVTVTASGRFLYAPLPEGYPFGEVTVACEGRAVSSPLVTAEAVQARDGEGQSLTDRLFGWLGS